jgi:hypothetical protein
LFRMVSTNTRVPGGTAPEPTRAIAPTRNEETWLRPFA